jgi:hypothetical protein
LSALLWVDDDLPFTFVFGTAPVVAIGATKTYAADMSDISQLVPFGDERGNAFYRGVILPQGQHNTNYSAACFTQVIDYLGAGTFGSTTMRVVPAEFSAQQLLNFSTTKSQEHRDSGDSNAAKQVLRASAKASTVAGNGQQRRRLLSLTAEEKQAAFSLRASLLRDLWATYEITPLTQTEVASLLEVLVAIVEQPTEVTDQVAAGAVEFASTVSLMRIVSCLHKEPSFLHTFVFQQTTRASLENNLGLSLSGASSIARTISFVLGESTLRNSSNPQSVADLTANITSTLRLASATQL